MTDVALMMAGAVVLPELFPRAEAGVAVGAVRAGALVGRGAAAGSGCRSRLAPLACGVGAVRAPDVGRVVRCVSVVRFAPTTGVGDRISSGGWKATGDPLPAMIASMVRSGVGCGR